MRKLTQGNEAVFRGAIAAGASYYAGYPISPSTEILNVASGWAAEHTEFRFLQAEDEIASANAIIGASLAGAKSFTATSGPGFSLMQEAVGYAQKVGVPCVFVNVQRVGPATGMPTMPGQGDIMQVRYGSTGDYTPLAFYPNGVEEAFRVTVQAFNAAEESLSPVVVLSDTFVAHLNEVVDLDELAAEVPVVERSIAALGRHEPGHPRFFAGVLMYEHGPNAGEPATADADEYLRQFYAAKQRHLEVAARYSLYEHAWNVDAPVLVIDGDLLRAFPFPEGGAPPDWPKRLAQGPMIDIAQFHPQLVHFVVALGVAGVILRLVSLTGKFTWTNPAATTLLLVAAAASILAVKSGAEAHGPAERVPGARETVEEHEELGERTRNLFLLVAALELAAIAFKQRPNWQRGFRVASGIGGIAAAVVLYQAGEAGGKLVYSYAGGVGLRSGDPADVQRLLVAGLYHQARAARAAGNHAEAARLVDELALQRPGDPSIPFLQAEAMIRDRQDFSGALVLLAAQAPDSANNRLNIQKGLLASEAYDSLGQPDSARVTLEALAEKFPKNRFIAEAVAKHQ